jgi:hypothetical protein
MTHQVIGYAILGLIAFLLFILVRMADYYIQIHNIISNKSKRGFWRDVASRLASSGGKSFFFMPVFMIPQKDEVHEVVVLKRKRNIWVVVFWLVVMLIFFIGFRCGNSAG